jgi:hypothetical protein
MGAMHETLTTPVSSIATGPAAHQYATVRPLPVVPLRTVAVWALAITVLAVGAWEVRMRALGLRAEDSDDTPAHWAAERRALADGPADGIAILGDSRALFDTDLAVWEEMTGRRPVQLALAGTSGRPFLADLAADERFRGLAVVGFTEFTYVFDEAALNVRVLDYTRTQSPAQRFGHQVYLRLSPWLAFLDVEYRLPVLVRRLELPNRDHLPGPFLFPWKLSESFAHRQTSLWPRIETDAWLRDKAKRSWAAFPRPPITDERVTAVAAETRTYVDRIRARGGEVLLLKPPSDGDFLAWELELAPRARVWDRLVREAGVVGLHWEDHPDMRGLDIPEWSHLTRASATRYTRAYVREAVAQLPWLRARVDEWRGR